MRGRLEGGKVFEICEQRQCDLGTYIGYLQFAHDEAQLRTGLCYESLNDLTKAEEVYASIGKKDDASTTDFAAAREAQKYLRLLKAKKNL